MGPFAGCRWGLAHALTGSGFFSCNAQHPSQRQSTVSNLKPVCCPAPITPPHWFFCTKVWAVRACGATGLTACVRNWAVRGWCIRAKVTANLTLLWTCAGPLCKWGPTGKGACWPTTCTERRSKFCPLCSRPWALSGLFCWAIQTAAPSHCCMPRIVRCRPVSSWRLMSWSSPCR